MKYEVLVTRDAAQYVLSGKSGYVASGERRCAETILALYEREEVLLNVLEAADAYERCQCVRTEERLLEAVRKRKGGKDGT